MLGGRLAQCGEEGALNVRLVGVGTSPSSASGGRFMSIEIDRARRLARDRLVASL